MRRSSDYLKQFSNSSSNDVVVVRAKEERTSPAGVLFIAQELAKKPTSHHRFRAKKLAMRISSSCYHLEKGANKLVIVWRGVKFSNYLHVFLYS
jgi:hypothetical protein